MPDNATPATHGYKCSANELRFVENNNQRDVLKLSTARHRQRGPKLHGRCGVMGYPSFPTQVSFWHFLGFSDSVGSNGSCCSKILSALIYLGKHLNIIIMLGGITYGALSCEHSVLSAKPNDAVVFLRLLEP